MSAVPSVVVFDVNETLSDMSPLAERFADVGAPGHLAKTWFAAVLRDGFALAAAGSSAKFAAIAAEVLRTTLAGQSLDRSLDNAVEYIMAGFTNLPVHPDVPDGVERLRAAGLPMVTLTNGATAVGEALLKAAGLRAAFNDLLSVEDAPRWKPAPEAYQYAAQACSVELSEMVLVAVHPWDIDGAARAGMRTAWINRSGGEYPAHFTPPDYTVTKLGELAERLR